MDSIAPASAVSPSPPLAPHRLGEVLGLTGPIEDQIKVRSALGLVDASPGLDEEFINSTMNNVDVMVSPCCASAVNATEALAHTLRRPVLSLWLKNLKTSRTGLR